MSFLWGCGNSRPKSRVLTALFHPPEDTLEPPPAPGFPEYGVAIVVVCGLIIITIPIILLVVRVMPVFCVG